MHARSGGISCGAISAVLLRPGTVSKSLAPTRSPRNSVCHHALKLLISNLQTNKKGASIAHTRVDVFVGKRDFRRSRCNRHTYVHAPEQAPTKAQKDKLGCLERRNPLVWPGIRATFSRAGMSVYIGSNTAAEATEENTWEYPKTKGSLTLPPPSQSASENISATFAGGMSLSLKTSANT